jgi:hypothetical protein
MSSQQHGLKFEPEETDGPDLPPYEITYTKRHDRMQTSGYYPHGDEIHARVSSPAFRQCRHPQGPDGRTAVFVGEAEVIVGVSSLDDAIIDILLAEGLTVWPDTGPECRPPFELGQRARTFSEAGVNRSDGTAHEGDVLLGKRILANSHKHPESSRSGQFE